MQTIATIKDLTTVVKSWKQAGLKIGFVPTMGNLHAGHLALVKAAKSQVDKIVVSIFVNPTQFGAGEDFDSYPRTERQDAELLAEENVDVLFLPAVAEIYHPQAKTVVSVKDISTLHCGVSRPGHFDGVATVVCKLFNMVQPDLAFFGEKDFQQLAVIRMMVRDLNIPVEIHSVATQRDSDGLALSSRNGYLTTEQRAIAPNLYRALLAARDTVLQGRRDFLQLEQEQSSVLTQTGFTVDYFSICNAENLLPAQADDKNLVILAAAKLGKPRLIDNITVSIQNN